MTCTPPPSWDWCHDPGAGGGCVEGPASASSVNIENGPQPGYKRSEQRFRRMPDPRRGHVRSALPHSAQQHCVPGAPLPGLRPTLKYIQSYMQQHMGKLRRLHGGMAVHPWCAIATTICSKQHVNMHVQFRLKETFMYIHET